MDDDFKSIGDYLAIAWRRKQLIIVTFVLSISIITAVIFKLPPSYKSTGTILIKSQQIPEELVQSTVQGFANVRINTLSQSILSSQRLKKIIEKFGLYEDESKISTISEIVGDMRKSIEIKQISADVNRRRRSSAIMSFTIAFEHGVPEVAQEVATELVTLFLDENVKSRTASAAQTTEFLEKESDRLRVQIEAIEEQIANYKQKNEGSLPDNMTSNLTRQKELNLLLFNSKREMSTLEEKKKLLLIDLDIAKRTPLIIPPQGDQQISEKQELENQLVQVRAELTDLAQKYSDEHPDIKRLKRKQVNLKMSLEAHVEEPVAEIKKENPQVRQVTARIDAINDSIAALVLAQQDLEIQISNLDEKINKMPQVERGIDSLVRDYENSKIKYQKIRNSLQKAELAMSLEEEQKSEQFSLLEPPQLPKKASKPNRPQLLLLGLMLSLGFGAGAATLAESLDGGIRGERALANITKTRPLVSVPYITTLQDEAIRKRNIVLSITALILLGISILLLVHFFYKPLDSIWFILMRKLSLV